MKAAVTISLLLYSSLVSAQTLDAADIIPTIGERFVTFTVTNTSLFSPGGSGANQIWDMSGFLYSTVDSGIVDVVNPASTPDAAVFPNASLAIKSFDASDTAYVRYDYYQQSLNQFALLGSVLPVVTYVNSNPEMLFRFPFSFNDEVPDTFCHTSSGLGITNNYCGTSSARFDGYGTLILPYGSYPDVYRIHHMDTSIRVGTTDTTVVSKYAWYRAGIHRPLLEYRTFRGSNGATLVGASIISPRMMLKVATAAATSFSCVPNPARNSLLVRFAKQTSGTARLINAVGQEVLATAFDSETDITLPIAGLPRGIYVLTVSGASGMDSKRVVVE